MALSGPFYVRFMDDILVISPTRWKIGKAVKVVNGMLGSLDSEKHPDKTFIGRIEKCFDFLGYCSKQYKWFGVSPWDTLNFKPANSIC